MLFQFKALDVRQWQQFEDLVLVTHVLTQDISYGRHALCGTLLEVQDDNFGAGIQDAPEVLRRLCVRMMAISAHEYWALDDKQYYITDVKVVELSSATKYDKEKATTAPCPTDYECCMATGRSLRGCT